MVVKISLTTTLIGRADDQPFTSSFQRYNQNSVVPQEIIEVNYNLVIYNRQHLVHYSNKFNRTLHSPHIEYGILKEGSKILTNKKLENNVF